MEPEPESHLKHTLLIEEWTDRVVTYLDGRPILSRPAGHKECVPALYLVPTPFTYEVTLVSGEKVEVEFDHTILKEPPLKPTVDETSLVEGSRQWYEYRTWSVYRAALAHEKEQREKAEQYSRVAQIMTAWLGSIDLVLPLMSRLLRATGTNKS